MALLANIDLGELLLLMVEVFFFVIWIWILIFIFTDLFRDHAASGWAKAAWVLLLVIIPLFGSLIYLIARGGGMRERALKARTDEKQHLDTYIREQADGSPAEELHKLNELKEKGALSEAEFEQAKTKLLA